MGQGPDGGGLRREKHRPRGALGCDCCLLPSDLQGPPVPAKAGSRGIRALWEGEADPGKRWGCVPGASFLHKLQTRLTRAEPYSPRSSPTTSSHTSRRMVIRNPVPQTGRVKPRRGTCPKSPDFRPHVRQLPRTTSHPTFHPGLWRGSRLSTALLTAPPSSTQPTVHSLLTGFAAAATGDASGSCSDVWANLGVRRG